VELYLEHLTKKHNKYDSTHGGEFPLVLANSRVEGLEPLSMSKIRRASNAWAAYDSTIYARLTYRGDPDHGKTFPTPDGEAPEDFGVTIYGTRRGGEKLGEKDGVPTADAIRRLDDMIAWDAKYAPYKFDDSNSPGENGAIVNDSIKSGFHDILEEFNGTKGESALSLTPVIGRDLAELARSGCKAQPLGLRDYNRRGRNPCRGGRYLY
jgi:hypothetical protein